MSDVRRLWAAPLADAARRLGCTHTAGLLAPETECGESPLSRELARCIAGRDFEGATAFIERQATEGLLSAAQLSLLGYRLLRVQFAHRCAEGDDAGMLHLLRRISAEFPQRFAEEGAAMAAAVLSDTPADYAMAHFGPAGSGEMGDRYAAYVGEVVERKAGSCTEALQKAICARISTCPHHVAPLLDEQPPPRLLTLLAHRCRPPRVPAPAAFRLRTAARIVLLAASRTGEVVVGLDPRGELIVWERGAGGEYAERHRLRQQHAERPQQLVFDDAERKVLLVTAREVQLLDPVRGEVARVIENPHLDAITGLALLPRAGGFVTGSLDGFFHFWEPSLRRRASAAAQRVAGFALAADESALFFVHGDRRCVDAVHLPDMRLQERVVAECTPIAHLRCSPCSRLLLLAAGRSVRLWRVADCALLATVSAEPVDVQLGLTGFAADGCFFTHSRARREFEFWQPDGSSLGSLAVPGGACTVLVAAGQLIVSCHRPEVAFHAFGGGK